jgi:hypothetical protein
MSLSLAIVLNLSLAGALIGGLAHVMTSARKLTPHGSTLSRPGSRLSPTTAT